MSNSTPPESLTELIALYRGGAAPYSVGSIAAAICRQIARQARLHELHDEADDTTTAEELRQGEEFLGANRTVVDDALKSLDGARVLEKFRRYVRSHPLGDDEGEGFRLLFAYDSLDLVASTAARFPPSRAATRDRRALVDVLDRIAEIISANLSAFATAAAATNTYCLEWAVAESSPLARIARVGAPDQPALIAERGHGVATAAASTRDCIDATTIIALAEGRRVSEPVRAHLTGCLHCAALVSAAVRDLGEQAPPLSFWKKVFEHVRPSAPWVIVQQTGSLVSTKPQEAMNLLRRELPADLVPIGAAARRAREVRVLLVDTHGHPRGQTSATVLTTPRIERGRFRIALRLPDTRLTGARAWVCVHLTGDYRLVVSGRVVGARLGASARGLTGDRAIAADAVEVAVVAPHQRGRSRTSRATKRRKNHR